MLAMILMRSSPANVTLESGHVAERTDDHFATLTFYSALAPKISNDHKDNKQGGGIALLGLTVLYISYPGGSHGTEQTGIEYDQTAMSFYSFLQASSNSLAF